MTGLTFFTYRVGCKSHIFFFELFYYRRQVNEAHFVGGRIKRRQANTLVGSAHLTDPTTLVKIDTEYRKQTSNDGQNHHLSILSTSHTHVNAVRIGV